MVSKKSHAAHKNTSKSGGSSPTGPISDLTPGQNPKLVLQNLNKDQLRKELKRRGIKASGNKSELLQRLQHNMHSPLKKRTEPQASGGSNNSPLENHHKSNGDSSRRTGHKDMVENQNQSRKQEKEERETLVLWRRPLITLKYFSKELWFNTVTYGTAVMQHKLAFISIVLSSIFSYLLFHLPGPHQKHLLSVWGQIIWSLYWLGLGVLSSVGLGTGLHTFILYLGPHIASVTLAAYECGGLNFPEPPYPDEIVCPTEVDPRWTASIWNIMSKVRLEGVMWGAGTALGELPPYFMARAARLSGYDPEDEEDLAEFEELQRKKDNPELLSTVDRLKLFVEKLVEKVGFFGILACASIPNPLFDLAGITCGHFLVPFWTFFGATLLGKAVIKMHIQKIFVIIAFNETLLERAVVLLGSLPVIGNRLEKPFSTFLVKQKERLHRKGVDSVTSSNGSLLSSIFEKFVIGMILYFVVSIVNSLAQSHHKRLHSKQRGSKKSKD